MRVVLQKDLEPSQPFEGIGTVLVYDNEGQYLLAAMWHREDGSIALTRAGEPHFNKLIADLGLEKQEVKQVTVPA